MSFDWSITVTGLVGVAGIVGTVIQGSRENVTTLRLAKEERVQQRLEQSYVELRRMLDAYERWTWAVMPVQTAADVDPYPLPPAAEASSEAMTLQVYWSPAVSKAIKEWIAASNKLITLRQVTLDMRGQPGLAKEWHETWRRGQEQKQVVSDLSVKITERMSAELRDDQGPAIRRRFIRKGKSVVGPSQEAE